MYYHDHCTEDIHAGVRIISSFVGEEKPLRYVGTFLQIIRPTCPHLYNQIAQIFFFAPVKKTILQDFICWLSVYQPNVLSTVLEVLSLGQFT